MILVQNAFGLVQIEVVLRRLRPRQVRDDFHPASQRRCFGGVGMHALELLQLPQRFFLGGLRHLGRFNFFAKLLNLFREFVAFAKLALDRLHLLAQIKLALRPIHVGARLGVDFLLNRQHFDLFVQQFIHAAQASCRVSNFKD